ncbi:MAG: methyl-accepting chemotaxis protein [Planctomycetota bacterium]
MTIKKKLITGFAVATIPALLLGFYAYATAVKVEHRADAITNQALPGSLYSGLADAWCRMEYVYAAQYVNARSNDDVLKGKAKDQLDFYKAESVKDLEKYGNRALSDADKALHEKTMTAYAQWATLRDKVIDLSDNGQGLAARELVNTDAHEAMVTLTTLTGELMDYNGALGETSSKGITDEIKSQETGVLFGMFGALVVSGAIGFFVSRGITTQMNRIASELSSGADQATNAAGQVSSSSQSLAQGASEQAASLEETSSSLEEMSSMTKKNADTAREATALSNEASASAARGNEAMQKMSSAITQIEGSAKETAKIIKVIDEIAFQTNLLALNAAVEAARAGEAGKGFAVVAEEVRNLAMRSAEAARNTSTLIQQSVENANSGVEISNEVASVLEDITRGSEKVNGLISEIAAASSEQATGIEQVNTAVAQMDKVTQESAANAEESAAAAEELASQSEQVRSVVIELQRMIGTKGFGDEGISFKPSSLLKFPKRKAAPVADAASFEAPPAPVNARPAQSSELIPFDDDFSDFDTKAA